jgi:hypothetical protein
MSSLARSIYCQKLRSTTQLGPATANPRFHAFDWKRFLASGGPAATGRQPALPRRHQRQREGTSFFTWDSPNFMNCNADATLTIASVFAAALQMGVIVSADSGYAIDSGRTVQFLFNCRFDLIFFPSGEVEAVKDAAEAVADVVEEAATLTEEVAE